MAIIFILLGIIIIGVVAYFLYQPKEEELHDFCKNREQYLRSQLK